jgi:hypothetical protein
MAQMRKAIERLYVYYRVSENRRLVSNRIWKISDWQDVNAQYIIRKAAGNEETNLVPVRSTLNSFSHG